MLLRPFLSLILLALYAAPVSAEVGSASASSDDAVKVGVILPLSGDAASFGDAFRKGMTLGIEKLSSQTAKRINFIYEDDGMQPKNSVSAFNKLVTTKDIDILVNVSSGTGKALAPLAEDQKLPFIAVASDARVSAGRNYVFNFWVTPEEEARVALPEALKRGYRKVARITSIQDGALAVRDAFDKENADRLALLLDEEYPLDVKDFKPYITKLRALKDIDAVVVILLPGQCAAFAKQVRQLGVHLPLFGFEMFEDANEVKISEGALIDQWYVNADDPDNVFLNEYQKRFPSASAFGASNGHDTVLMIGAAIESGIPAREMNKFLATLKNFKGALGIYSASGDNRFTLPAAVKIVTADGFRKVYR